MQGEKVESVKMTEDVNGTRLLEVLEGAFKMNGGECGGRMDKKIKGRGRDKVFQVSRKTQILRLVF